MKRITSTLLVAAIPALSALGVLPGWNSAPQIGQRGGQAGPQTGPQAGGQGEAEGAGAAAEEDDAPPPEGFDPRGKTTFDIFGRRSKVRGNTFEDRIKGGWRLTAMSLGNLTSNGRQAQGFLHIGDSFLSMEIHALWNTNGGGAVPNTDVHLTFTSEYTFNATGKLSCSTVIGSFVDEATGELIWERTGFEREYRVREVQNELELTFQNGSSGVSRLVFQPYLPRRGGELDVFGRPIGTNFGGTDIYGRKTANERLERDIFGRPIQPEPGPGEGAGGDPDSDPAEEGDGGTDRNPRLDSPKGPGAGGSPLGNRGGR